MLYLGLCAITLLGAYFINIVYVSVFYHRALAHSSLSLHPKLKSFVLFTGNWVTGVDPKGWVCMHRLHHTYSDQEKDPHSPVGGTVWKVFLKQLVSYKKTLAGLICGKRSYTNVVRDLDFPVHWLNQSRLWALPYLAHLGVAIAIGWTFSAWLLGICYWIGIMSHPIQGWMVNALAHSYGYRNHPTPDNSRNNYLVALLVAGEGFQNNHHHNPSSADFHSKRGELDLGYVVCLVLEKLALLQIKRGDRHQKLLTTY